MWGCISRRRVAVGRHAERIPSSFRCCRGKDKGGKEQERNNFKVTGNWMMKHKLNMGMTRL